MKKGILASFLVFAFVFAAASTASAAYTHMGTLKMGSTGSQVMSLQQTLNANGFVVSTTGAGSVGMESSYFGVKTQVAVKSFQASKGLVSDGIVGPATGAALAALTGTTPGQPLCPNGNTVASSCTMPPAGTPTGPTCPNGNLVANNCGASSTGSTGPLAGTEGDLEFEVSLDSDIEIDLGDTEEVVEVEIEAVDGDVMVERVDFYFDSRPWLYFDEVNLLVNGSEVKSFSSSSDFSEVGGEYRARFSGLTSVVREDDTATIGLELKALASMAGTRSADTVAVSMDDDSFRFVDGSGAIMTSDDADINAIDVDVTFNDSFGDGDVSVSIGDDSPEDAVIILDEDVRTEGVSVLEFDVEAEDGDIEATDVLVTFSSNASSVADILYRAHLYHGSTLLKSKSVTATTVAFDNVDVMIDEDEEEGFTVKVDFNETENVGVTGIDELTVVSVMVSGENSDFADVSDTLTVNEVHQLVVEGLVDEFDDKDAEPIQLGDDTIAKFTFMFDLTAYEGDFYIDEDGSDFTVTLDNAGTTIISTTISATNAFLTSDDSYRINDGQTRSFTLEIQVADLATGAAEAVRATVTSLEYFSNSDMSTSAGDLTLGAPDYRSGTINVLDAS